MWIPVSPYLLRTQREGSFIRKLPADSTVTHLSLPFNGFRPFVLAGVVFIQLYLPANASPMY
jgi:hypothetical protein